MATGDLPTAAIASLGDDPRMLSAPDLVLFARLLFAKEDRRTHWTTAAIALGRITDERIFERPEYGAAPSPEEWAKDILGMTRGEVQLALKLWRAMGRHPEVPWARLKKPTALLLDEVLRAGGDVMEWCLKAKDTTTKDFEREVRRQLKEDVFLSLTIRYPESMAEMVDEAFRRAVYLGLSTIGDETMAPDPATWRQPSVLFRAFEVLVKEFIDATTPIPETPA